MMMLQWIILALVLVMISLASMGCAGFGINAMSPEQLAQWVKNKDATCSRLTGVYMGATINAVSVSIDKGIPPGAGSVTVDGDCKVTITSDGAKKVTP